VISVGTPSPVPVLVRTTACASAAWLPVIAIGREEDRPLRAEILSTSFTGGDTSPTPVVLNTLFLRQSR
jgi:hypothetical protein